MAAQGDLMRHEGLTTSGAVLHCTVTRMMITDVKDI
jgi:hypothetical protein